MVKEYGEVEDQVMETSRWRLAGFQTACRPEGASILG